MLNCTERREAIKQQYSEIHEQIKQQISDGWFVAKINGIPYPEVAMTLARNGFNVEICLRSFIYISYTYIKWDEAKMKVEGSVRLIYDDIPVLMPRETLYKTIGSNTYKFSIRAYDAYIDSFMKQYDKTINRIQSTRNNGYRFTLVGEGSGALHKNVADVIVKTKNVNVNIVTFLYTSFNMGFSKIELIEDKKGNVSYIDKRIPVGNFQLLEVNKIEILEYLDKFKNEVTPILRDAILVTLEKYNVSIKEN